VNRISSEDAFLMLAKWSVVRLRSPQEERAAIQVVMSRPAIKIGGQRAASTAFVDQVLPHSQKALLTLRDENGEDVGVTVDLTGAEWEYELVEMKSEQAAASVKRPSRATARTLAATFPNGNRYVFGERVNANLEESAP